MSERQIVYKVVREEEGVLKSAVIGSAPLPAFQCVVLREKNYRKFKKFEVVYPVGSIVRRRCLAFKDLESAETWCGSMARVGFPCLQVWKADTSRCVEIRFVADLEKLTVKIFGLAVGCRGFFDRSMTDWDRVRVSGADIPINHFRAVKCSDLQLLSR